MNSTSSTTSSAAPLKVYLDLTHLGRHVTGIERIAIELFEKQSFAGAVMQPVRSRGMLSMIIKQQIWLPLLALLHPSAKFVFPGFPPSPLFVLARRRQCVIAAKHSEGNCRIEIGGVVGGNKIDGKRNLVSALFKG